MKIRATQADRGKGGYFVHPERLSCLSYIKGPNGCPKSNITEK